ncbi:FCD domain-containing protein [Caproicibacter fermentans]|uniref:FCD domain-containing protein n=1 Tax=Caproicibacter fermentans TaxID=2576756 RepID=UPI0011129821
MSYLYAELDLCYAFLFVAQRSGCSVGSARIHVCQKDKNLALHLLEVRLIIEPEVASIAAVRATEEDIHRIGLQCEKVKKLILRENTFRFHQR